MSFIRFGQFSFITLDGAEGFCEPLLYIQPEFD